MISIESVEKYCKNYAEIENYDKAVNDITQIWECHHRLEVAPFSGKKVSMDFLKDQGIYYNQPPEALIFLTKAEHNFLTHKGKPKSEEAKRKMSESRSKIGWKIDPTTGKRVWYRKEN